MHRFYTIIIGTELLNGRRMDGHFEFINQELIKRHWEHAGSFVIADIPELIEHTIRLIANDPESILFCFGGIGATPDDYTRQCAANALSSGQMEYQPEARRLIEERFGEKAYPNRIQMAHLPTGAKIIENPVNRVPGFYLSERFFFVPGFPEMAHPMLRAMLERFFPGNRQKHRQTVFIQTSEESLISFMQALPQEVELSSLPEMTERGAGVTLSLSSYDPTLLTQCFENLETIIHSNGWESRPETDTTKET